MPELSIWTLIVGLGLLAFGLGIKVSALRHVLQSSLKVSDELRRKIARLEGDKEESARVFARDLAAVEKEKEQHIAALVAEAEEGKQRVEREHADLAKARAEEIKKLTDRIRHLEGPQKSLSQIARGLNG